jgi:hypothetical protein
MLDFGSLLKRAKDQGKKFLVAESKDGKGFELFFTESSNRLPDFVTGITVEVAKKIHKSSGGKFSPTSALEAVLTHVNTTSRIVIEKYEKEINGENEDNNSTRSPSSVN